VVTYEDIKNYKLQERASSIIGNTYKIFIIQTMILVIEEGKIIMS
jgi:hypothetical protein